MAPRIARVIDAGGGMRAFDVRAKRLDEGRLLLVLSDLTEVELLAKQVADLQRYNENIIQNMNSALLVVDLDGRITYGNPTAMQVRSSLTRVASAIRTIMTSSATPVNGGTTAAILSSLTSTCRRHGGGCHRAGHHPAE